MNKTADELIEELSNESEDFRRGVEDAREAIRQGGILAYLGIGSGSGEHKET